MRTVAWGGAWGTLPPPFGEKVQQYRPFYIPDFEDAFIILYLFNVISTVFESKDKPTQMTKQSFTIVDFITYR